MIKYCFKALEQGLEIGLVLLDRLELGDLGRKVMLNLLLDPNACGLLALVALECALGNEVFLEGHAVARLQPAPMIDVRAHVDEIRREAALALGLGLAGDLVEKPLLLDLANVSFHEIGAPEQDPALLPLGRQEAVEPAAA